MYERMLNKNETPQIKDIEDYIGKESCTRLQELENLLQSRYIISRELRFPFGNSYGWGYKYSDKTKHLFYLFFEKEALTAMIQIGDKAVPALMEQFSLFSSKAQSLWETRYPCGKNGGWIHYRITSDSDLEDVIRFIGLRIKERTKR